MEWINNDIQTFNFLQLLATLFGTYLITRHVPKRWKDR